MAKYHLLHANGGLKRVYSGVDVDIRERVIRLLNIEPPYETAAIIALAPGESLERVRED
jgi:hypothetical protein